MQMKYFLRKGCQIYAVQEVSKEKRPSLEQYPVLSEFPDVFPKKLPRLPPERELDLTIELKPITEPISKTPYKMTAPTLQELQNSIERIIGYKTHSTQYFTLGCSCNICQEERWFFAVMHKTTKT